MIENKLDATLCLCVLKKEDFQLWKKGALYFDLKRETLHDPKKIEKEIQDAFNKNDNYLHRTKACSYQSFKENWQWENELWLYPPLMEHLEGSSHLIFREEFDNSENEIVIFGYYRG